jgi:dephospho-CoA kinase
MKKTLIGLVGRKGAGKGTAAKILAADYGAAVFRFSDPLRAILTTLHLPIDREHLVALSEALRAAFGEDILLRTLLTDAEKTDASFIVLDGIRRIEELTLLETLAHFSLVSVDATLETRYARITNRGENQGEHAMTLTAFEKTENASTETTIPAVEARAHFHIQNNGTPEELIAALDALVKQLDVCS